METSQTPTQEAKRRQKALPATVEPPTPLGCLGVLIVYLGACAALFAATGWVGWWVLGAPAVLSLAGILGRYLYGFTLLALVRQRWSPRGIRCLLVLSNSPAWEERVRTAWLSQLGDAAVVLNWSERASWRSSLAVRVFRRFCGERRNFNPAVVVFRGLRQPYVFRFFHAFQQAKAGRQQYLEMLEAEMFAALGLR